MSFFIKTPLVRSSLLSDRINKEVLFKMESSQPVGSFKIRGIGQLCQYFVSQGKNHLVCRSGGNAGYATAYVGQKLNKKVTVVCFEGTPDIVIKACRALGAKVEIVGHTPTEAEEYAKTLCQNADAAYIHPNDHPEIWKGHSTIIDEIEIQTKKPDVIIASVGGGGLLSGLLEGMHRHNWDDVPVLAVETRGADSLAQSIKAQKRITLDKVTSIAKTLGEPTVNQQAFDWTQNHDVMSLVVNDKNAIQACWEFANEHRVLVEPSCGAALSAVYDDVELIRKYKKILVVVCGGIGISLEQLIEWKKTI